eukprot:GGOE01017883.1.p1 GENE.GGOE01017883.1~~GGOE01017883.1.p1  ORF type:complete len:694 (+),score=205.50 GGOE01017883.1:167-2083(+)
MDDVATDLGIRLPSEEKGKKKGQRGGLLGKLEKLVQSIEGDFETDEKSDSDDEPSQSTEKGEKKGKLRGMLDMMKRLDRLGELVRDEETDEKSDSDDEPSQPGSKPALDQPPFQKKKRPKPKGFASILEHLEDRVKGVKELRSKLLVVPRTGVTFDDVAGAEEAKDRLREVVDFLKSPDRYRQFGARIPRGVLLTGEPGTGKTLLAKAVAGEAGVPFLPTCGSEFVEMFGGRGAARVREMFKLASEHPQCIVFIDEIDAVGRARGTGLGHSNDEKEQTLNQLLISMDGFEANSGVVVLAATNRPDILDPALTRAGRFDRQIVVELPDLRARRAVLQVHSSNKPLGGAVSLDALAQQTPGLSGADLANVMNEAAIFAARRDLDTIGVPELEDALDRVVAGMAGNPLRTSKSKELIAYHEVGHAICSTLTPGHDPVKKVTLIPRGQAKGLTWFTPAEELSLYTRQQVFATIVGALGGRAAEEVVYGRSETTSGAASDLQQVTRLARAMVMKYGFSDIGPWNLSEQGDNNQDVVLRLLAQERMSDKLAADIDRRVRTIVADAYNVAKSLLIAHRPALDALAARLLEVETLSGDELRAQLAQHAAIPEENLAAVEALAQQQLLPAVLATATDGREAPALTHC